MSFGNLKIGVRLGMGFAAVLAVLIAVLGLGLSSMARINSHVDHIVNQNNIKLLAANDMVNRLKDISTYVSNVVLLTNEEEMQDAVKKRKAAHAQYGEARARLAKIVSTEHENALLGQLDQAVAGAQPLIDKVLQLRDKDNYMEATQVLMKEAAPAQQKAIAILDKIIGYEEDLTAKAAEAAQTEYATVQALMLGLGALAIALVALAAWIITRSITRPLNEAVKVAETVAAGDLDSHLVVNTRDETGRLLQALKDMNDSLVKIVAQVRTGTDTIDKASSQIAAGNADLSSRTEQQASALQQTASSMEQLTSTVRQNVDNARQANQLAVSASDVAVKGGEVVARVVETMGSINESASKIVNIIAVIDSIAFQTNILALNAAVEAARAGEQGRGFAVVASEVRALAQRSAGAAKEIKELIADSVEKVETGSKLVGEAGDTMREVVSSVKRVNDIMAEILAASQEQSAGIEEVNRAIGQMDQTTQQNASLVEQGATAAAALQDQASNLARVVSVFKIGGQQLATAQTDPRRNGQIKRVQVFALK